MRGLRNSLLPALLLVVALAAFSHTYRHFESSNELSRLYLAFALANHGTTSIDRLIHRWGDVTDKSTHGGRYYSDKSPGSSWVAAVPAVLLRIISAATGRAFDRDQALAYTRILAVSFPCLIFFLFLFEKFKAFETDNGAPAALLLAYMFGSPAWVYSTLLYGHQLAAAALFSAYLILRRSPESMANGEVKPIGPVQVAVAGALLGLSVALDYVAIWGAVCVLAYAFRAGHGRRGWMWLGFLVPVVALCAYHWVSFGGPLTTGYSFKAYPRDAAVHARGILGITWPSTEVLAGVLLSHKRGLFYWSPWLIFAVPGFVRMGLRKELRADFALCLALILGNVALIGSFSDWTAGWSYGPRHLVPTLPFLLVPILVEIRAAGRIERLAFAALAGASVVTTAMAVITFPHVPVQLKNPLTDLFWTLIVAGDTVPLIGGLDYRASLILGSALVALVTVWFGAALGAKYGGYWKGGFIAAAGIGAILWVAFQAGAPPQQDSDKQYAMSQVYAAAGDFKNVYRELEAMATSAQSIDLRAYATYRLWKLSEEMKIFTQAQRWREKFLKLRKKISERPPPKR